MKRTACSNTANVGCDPLELESLIKFDDDDDDMVSSSSTSLFTILVSTSVLSAKLVVSEEAV